MDPSFWLSRWAANQIGFHRDSVHPLLERHWAALSVPRDSAVLVPLCGKSVDMVYLRRLGHRVVGIELSPLAIEQFFSEQGLRPERRDRAGLEVYEAGGIELVRADFFDVRREHFPELIAAYDRAAFIALPPDTGPRYAQHLLSLLPHGAPVLLIGLDYEQSQMNGPPFSTPEVAVRRCFSSRQPEALEILDALDPRFRERGVTRMTETAWRL